MSTQSRPRLDEVRAKLSNESGRTYWRSLDELVADPEVQSELKKTFPSQEAVWMDPVGRRSFLQLMGASLSLAGLGACTKQPAEYIAPYANSPESLLPGEARYFASSFRLGGATQGLLVESHMGRPTKIEGNPQHPSSLGSTDSIAQAQVLGLYDPDRSQTVTKKARISTSAELSTALKEELDARRAKRGEGLRVLSRSIDSPTLAAQREAFLEAFPRAVWHQYEPANRDGARAGAIEAFGENVECRYDLSKADVILSLDADFLVQGPGCVANARGFAAGRKGRSGMESMNRLYAVEATPTITGAAAEHRLSVKHSGVAEVALALAKAVGSTNVTGPLPQGFAHGEWVRAVAADLTAHRGRCVVIAGDQQPGSVHAIAHALNDALGNVGATVEYTEPLVAAAIDQTRSMIDLVRDINADQVQTLIVLDGNPVFDSPADLDFASAYDRVPFRLHLGLYEDETAVVSHWHVPGTHFLESWSDARAHDGTLSVVQPLIAPLYDGISVHELLGTMIGEVTTSHDAVKKLWQDAGILGDDFEANWNRTLHDGVAANTAFPTKSVTLAGKIAVDVARMFPGDATDGLELALRPDPHIWDGRYANNGWLQELPKPTTRLTWDNAALVSPRTAEELDLEDGRMVRITAGDDTLEVPAWIVPGHADGAVTLHFGYGRERGGRVCAGAGANAFLLQSSASPYVRRGVTIERLGERIEMACTQDHHGMEGDFASESTQKRLPDLLRVETFDRFAENGAHGAGGDHGAGANGHAAEKADEHGEGHGDDHGGGHHGPISLLDDVNDHEWDGHAWGMVIDLNACIGCSACTIACQAENNIPVVGRTEVSRGREMHWIRVDRYFTGDVDTPHTHHQPVPCMHCEHAPCEVVCPVGATAHSKEGLNDMVYNRCVGTRYCSNNCPYKVRRFNFFQYADYDTESLKLLHNPDVTVRFRGVMEKCTYCVQRINSARVDAKKDGRRIRDGEVVSACQQVCPTQAIAFGDINDPDSEVAHLRAEPHNYGMLDKELNTRPRTTYLSKLTNPNPELEPPAPAREAAGHGATGHGEGEEEHS